MKTKSLSLILMLALIITIGGVYAAWTYAETPLSAVHGHLGSFGLSNAVINNSKGTITVDATNAHLVIDQTSSTDYTAKLDATGTITFTFTPSEIWKETNETVTEITMQWKLVTTGNPDTFEIDDGNGAKKLFTTFDDDTKTDVIMSKNLEGKFVGTLDASALKSLITINTFTLDSYEDYEAFSTKLGTFGNIGIELSEKP